MGAGAADYFRETESLEKVYDSIAGLSLIKNASVDYWYHSFLQHLKEEHREPDLFLMSRCSEKGGWGEEGERGERGGGRRGREGCNLH